MIEPTIKTQIECLSLFSFFLYSIEGVSLSKLKSYKYQISYVCLTCVVKIYNVA
jgi:hypothetical protein